MVTNNHQYNTPTEGEQNWGNPINENFKEIDTDIEIRDLETNLSNYEPEDGAKFLSTDTGRVHIGDGSSWQIVGTLTTTGAPGILCYEKAGTAYAETPDKTYKGNCIFDAAQQAIDTQIQAEQGNIDVFVKGGVYELTQGLLIDAKGSERIRLVTPGWSQVRLNTHQVTDRAVIEVNPDLSEDDSHYDRCENVRIGGFHLNDRQRSGRDIDAVHVNDTGTLEIEGLRIRGGYRRGLWIQNIWQGIIDKVIINGAGSETDSVPAIQVGSFSDNHPFNAINHIQFNHLQGDPTLGFEHAYFELRGQATRIDVNFPNVELYDDTRGFVWNASQTSSGIMSGQIRGAQITGGDPAIEAISNCNLQVVGGDIDARTAIKATESTSKLSIGGGIRMSGASAAPVVELANVWVNMGNFRIEDGERGIVLRNCQFAQISGGIIRNIEKACLKASQLTGIGASFGDLVVSGATAGENPIYLENVNNLTLDNILARAKSPVPAIRVGGCDNLLIGDIAPAGQATEIHKNNWGSSFRRNRGTATISAEQKTSSVTHKLAGTPDVADIVVTPASSLGDASSWYVSATDATSFEITVDTAPGQEVLFSWQSSI